MNLMSPSSDLKELQAQNELFKKQKAEFDRQLKDLTKGQSLAKMELEARKVLDDAKREAATIVANAKRGVEGVEKAKCEYAELKAKIEKDKEATEEAKREALKAKQEADQLRGEANSVKAKLDIELRECAQLKQSLKNKAKEIQDYLVRASGSLN